MYQMSLVATYNTYYHANLLNEKINKPLSGLLPRTKVKVVKRLKIKYDLARVYGALYIKGWLIEADKRLTPNPLDFNTRYTYKYAKKILDTYYPYTVKRL